MTNFSYNAIKELSKDNDKQYYVYGLINPKTKRFFYIGKGTENRVFDHKSSGRNSSVADEIKRIEDSGDNVERIIINYGLSEEEALLAEATLIGAINYERKERNNQGCEEVNLLTNKQNGYHAKKVMSVECFEDRYGAEMLSKKDIKHKLMVIKINKLYDEKMDKEQLYNTVRGFWRASKKKAEKVDYVLGVYESHVVAIYKPTEWHCVKDNYSNVPKELVCMNGSKEDLSKVSNRIYFSALPNYLNVPKCDEDLYYKKNLSEIIKCKGNMNPIAYLFPIKSGTNGKL